ncbi:MAG: DsrE family protein [Campylobacterales bacterium]
MKRWEENGRKLLIVWSSGDEEVARKMVLLYSGVMMERGYWDEAILMIWGPSAKILAESPQLRNKIKEIKASGVRVMGCIVCAEDYGVSDTLDALEIELTHTGDYLTRCLQEGWRVLTF